MNTRKVPIPLMKQSVKADSTLDIVFQLSLDLVCIWGKDGYFQKLNPAWQSVLGWSEEELRSQPGLECVHPDDRELTQKAVIKCSVGKIVEYENRFRHQDGSYRSLFWRVSQNDEGLFYGVAKEITNNSYLTETKLRESERRFRAVFNQTFQLSSLLKLDGTILEDNQTAQDFCQLKHSDLVGLPFWELHCWTISKETQERLKGAIAQAASGDTVRYEADILSPNNTVLTIDFSLKPLYGENGQVELLIAEGRDLTERKRVEQSLQQAIDELTEWKNRYEAIGEIGGLLLYDWNQDTGELIWSQNIEQVLGYPLEEMQGGLAQWEELIHPDDRAKNIQVLHQVIAAKKDLHLEYRMRKKDGTYITIEDRGKLYLDSSGNLNRMVGYMVDISDIYNELRLRKQVETALRESEERFRSIFEQAAVGITQLSQSGQYLKVNPRFCEIVKYSESELLEKRFQDITDPEDQETDLDLWHRLYTGELQNFYREKRYLRKDGQRQWVNLMVSLIRDSAGTPQYAIAVVEDIQERKEAQDKLQKAYQQLTLHVDNSPLAVLEWDCEFRLQRWSGQAEKLFGWKAEEVLGKYPTEWQFIYQDDVQRVDRILADLLNGTKKHTVDENRNYTKNGSVVYCQWYNSAIVDEFGNLVSILSLIQDITERKEAEVALQEVMVELEKRVEERTAQLKQTNDQLQSEIAQHQQTAIALGNSEAQFRRVFDEAPIGMTLASLDDYYIRVNRAFYTMLGYSESELMTQSFKDITHPEDLQLEIPYMEQLIQGEIDSFQLEKRYLKKNHDVLWVNLKLIALREQSGEIHYTLAMIEDITKRKQVLEALGQSEARYRAIVEDQTELICRFKPDGTLTFVNDAYCRYFNKQHSELIGYSFMPAIPEEDQEFVSQSFSSLSAQQPIITYEHRVILPGGEIRWQQWTDRVMFDNSGIMIEFQAVGRDITPLKQAEAEIRNALEKERELSELRSSFVSLVSHEFRTPLTTILSSSELLERYDQRLSEEKKHTHHQRIQSAVSRMTQLLNDVLTIGKAGAGQLKFQPAPLNLETFCYEIVESIQVSASRQHKIEFVTQGDCSQVEMDENLLRHILSNLLSNAIKYSPQGGEVKIDLNCHSESAVFRIQDSGIGIPSEYLNKMFNSFQRASNVGTIQGTGLGLAIVKKCVDLHQGKIEIESKVGIGTTFIVTLPIHRS
ncbi:MAG TPA: hypothetical protein DCL61_30525 [Cyanobacteria bacterium UBA12227]|nr:hypothetical protein [Cyanobacteria bacterium UBA12227]HAX90130.1 hypothetical protein [Cyanobacteria bacterium UBA11370]